ncbi:rRNA-processing protein and EBNA1-binding protein ebp2, partial [Ascosphaera atra]
AKKNVENREKHAGPVDKKTEESKKAAEEEEEQSSEGSDNDEGESKTTEDKQDKGENEAEESEEEDEDEDEEDEDDIPLSDLEEEDTTDVVPHQRLTINNSAAIRASLKRISFLTPQTAFSEHNSLVSKQQLDVPDVHDDLQRELQFYSVCQNATKEARSLLKKEGVPFSRPGDYFAEMVKSDEHMSKIKKKLFEEAAAKKASAEAKRQRDLKKFGKQVQVAKLQQRAKEKKEMLEKVNNLKRSAYPPAPLPVSD